MKNINHTQEAVEGHKTLDLYHNPQRDSEDVKYGVKRPESTIFSAIVVSICFGGAVAFFIGQAIYLVFVK